MKQFLLILAFLASPLSLLAQTAGPVRLALVSATDNVSTAADMLTAQLSGNPKLQLLERDQINKVYHEQNLSVGNTDCVKLGQLLGADGVLLLEANKEGTNESLNVRLVAVKPGVVLIAEKLPWPVKEPTAWSVMFARRLATFLPKLTVPLKDAIPISLVNFRSAESSGEVVERERQLKLLAIQRLSREPQLFVLERQQMQLLSGEKELQADDSQFWKGSYLLEGVVDQNGYSPDLMTIDARLTPAKGGAPILFNISGTRTNLAEIINQLVLKVDAALQVSPAATEWNAIDEARQYFTEAQWALRWGAYREAQAAADSAWALGKTDIPCAQLRMQACIADILASVARYQFSDTSLVPGGFDANGNPSGPMAGEDTVQADIKSMAEQNPYGMAVQETLLESQRTRLIDIASADRMPDPRNIDKALQVLEIYAIFNHQAVSEASLADFVKQNPDWLLLGIASLEAASKVLQNFNFFPASQAPVTEKLAELRAEARSVAGWISRIPAVHDLYFVGDKIASHDQLAGRQIFFECEVDWGFLWQDRPEDGLDFYRELMASPVFCYVHSDFWIRSLPRPRLAAWSENDRQRLPVVWDRFIQELKNSPNRLLQLEALALTFADAHSESKNGEAFTNLCNLLVASHDTLVTNNVELLFDNWGLNDLLRAKASGTITSRVNDSLQSIFDSEYRPKLVAMNQEYWQTTCVGNTPQGRRAAYEKQKQLLQSNQPFDPRIFGDQFFSGFKDYSRAQALELLPLLAAYKTKMTGTWARIGVMNVDQVVKSLNQIINPPAPSLQPKVQAPTAPQAPAISQIPTPTPAKVTSVETVTNVLTVNQFLPIPLDDLPGAHFYNVAITAHHLVEGKLLLDVKYDAQVPVPDQYGRWAGSMPTTLQAIAILDLATEHWNVISYPVLDDTPRTAFYHRSTLLHGDLFTSDGGQIRKYDFNQRRWQVLSISDGGNYELFAVNDHLYAASDSMIFEIVDGSKSTHILASTRRQPPVSALDTQSLGLPTLFAGPGQSLRASIPSGIYTWTGSDWRKDSAAPPAAYPGTILPEGVLFASDGFNRPANLSWLAAETNVVVFGLGNFSAERSRPPPDYTPDLLKPAAKPTGVPQPAWKLPPELSLSKLPATFHQSDCYLLAGHSGIQEITDGQRHIVKEKVLNQDGYNATLLVFSPGLPKPQKICLKFDSPDGCPPLAGFDPNSQAIFPGMPPAWLLFAGNQLVFAAETPLDDRFRDLDRPRAGYQAGIWLLPVSQFEPSITARKLAHQAQLDQKAAAAAQAQKNLLARYDTNHNGVIDLEEREAALDDPSFIESELNVINTNDKGWLTAPELAWFDANQNKTVEPKEQAGIEIAQHLLAAQVLKKFDDNGDGFLEPEEFAEYLHMKFSPGRWSPALTLFQNADGNGDGRIDVVELGTRLKAFTVVELKSPYPQKPFYGDPSKQNSDRLVDSPPLYKAAVEFYWQHPIGTTHHLTASSPERSTNSSQRQPQTTP